MAQARKMLIQGGRVFDHDGNLDKPEVADILVEDGAITAVGGDLKARAGADAEVVDASNCVVMPGLIDAHYHSHDVLCRGLFEELSLEMWLLYTLPMNANRSKEEVRARTLVGALESLHAGVTTVQDMLGLVPFKDDLVDTVLQAYKDSGIRVVFSPMISDIAAIGMMRDRGKLPEDVQEMLGTKTQPMEEQLQFVESQFKRHPASGTLHWALAPFAPQRCTPKMLEHCRDLADKYDLPVFTHVYETRAQALIAREQFQKHNSSLISYLDSVGLLNKRLNIVHSVWITRGEMDMMAAADAGIVLNHLSNLKLKSGVAPMLDMMAAGVRLGLGCDNCSGTDVQNMFQAMKAFCMLGAVSDPEPQPGIARAAMRNATLGSARAAGLAGKAGAIKPGHRADVVLLDLTDMGWVPFNSALRQIVYTETGRGVKSVIVDGRVVVKDNRSTVVDESALRREVESLMRHFITDYDQVKKSREKAIPYMLEAHRDVWSKPLPMHRFLTRTLQ